MLNYFCSKCGGKNLYQFQKPKFCSHCGLSFSVSAAPPLQGDAVIRSSQFEVNINAHKKTNQNINVIEDDNEDFEQPVQDYSSMRGLDVNIEQYNNNNGVKLGDLVSDEPPQKQIQANKKKQKPRGRKKIAKSLPESFTSEAKMSGRNQNIPEFGDSEE
jgi:hypothetical protein